MASPAGGDAAQLTQKARKEETARLKQRATWINDSS